MSAAKGKNNPRYSRDDFWDDSTASEKGEYFVTHQGKEWDSRSVVLLHNGVDTVKQLYKGYVKLDRFEAIEKAYEAGIYTVQIDGFIWKIGSARRGGYRYSLNNSDLGVLILLGSFYVEPKYEGDHLKIELSPHYILSKNSDELQEWIDYFADLFVHMKRYTGVAVHLCADVQGWQPPNDLDQRLVTRANRITKYSGETDLAFERHAIATVYGKGETFTFGGASSLQFSVYNKSKLISKNQNVQEYWHTVYSQKVNLESFLLDSDDYDAGKPLFKKDIDVYRLEARFHHSVIAQFARSIGEDLVSFKAIVKHLTGFWRYAFKNFRLDDSPTYISCFWQLMRDDVVFSHDSSANFEYKRIYKQTDFDAPPSDRVIKIIFGLLASSYRKLKYTLDHAMDCLRKSGIYSCLLDLYKRRVYWLLEYTDSDADFDILGDLEQKLIIPVPLVIA